MARYSFGGEITHVLAAPTSGVITNPLVLQPSATVTFKASPGGSTVTDFKVWNQSSGAYDITATSIVSTAGGNLPRFQGPDGVTELWTQATDGTWLRLKTYDQMAIADGSLTIAKTTGLQSALDAKLNTTDFPTQFSSNADTYLPAQNYWPSVVLNPGDDGSVYPAGTRIYRRSVSTSTPISFTELTVGNSTTDGTTFTTASVTATSNMRLLIVTTGVAAGGAPLASTAVSGQGLTWTRIADQSNTSATAGIIHAALYLGTGTATTGTLTIAPGGTVESIAWREIDVVNGGSIVQTGSSSPAVTANPASVTLSGVNGANAVIGFIAQNASNTITTGSGMTALGSPNTVASVSITGVTEYTLVGQNAVNFGVTGSVKRVVIAAEIAHS